MSDIVCPDCKGNGSLGAFIDFADRRKSGYYDGIECMRCKGSGVIDQKTEAWMRIGGTHRTWRVAQHESIGACARRLGMSAAELSGMEQGRADPSVLVADTPVELRDAP